MDLLASTWMTRSLGEPVASVALEQDDSVLVGGWDGCLKRWDSKGDLLWSTRLNDRVNDVATHGDSIVATAGLHVVCVERTTGEVRWSHALEGSADAVVIHEQGIYAVSSVYDIEHNDFIESAVWSFDLQGTERWVTRMDERPWTIMVHEGMVWLGLGRPKCGFATIDKEGALGHRIAPVEAPITAGANNEHHLLFGHADGSVSDSNGAVLFRLDHGTESLACNRSNAAAADEVGNLRMFDYDGGMQWSSHGARIESHKSGFEVDGEPTHWVARWSGTEGVLEVLNNPDGSVVATSSSLHVRFLDANKSRVIAGCENGDVHVWERTVFERRLSSKTEAKEAPKDARKSALQDKLRKLREQ
jgi:hypothetical protein